MSHINRIIFKYAVYGFIFVAASGSLLHFLYYWSGQNMLAGFISAVNESTWEHMKLMFIPMLLYALFIFFKFRKTIPSAFPAFAIASIIAIFLIPVLFYTYQGILGFNVNFINLAIFYISDAAGFTVFTILAEKKDLSSLNLLFFLIYLMLLIMFIFFTYFPPGINLFISPV